ncbi:aminotransferase class V-fold PLP-dependent enzyme [Paenibacillus glycanilyticus]|uniref:aminotransferase class V-fold PLP-dependent enzyme n=1 Tax=Paenibacillus glycanilyticus TaxID=126569 RepID=UPI001F350132|nr:aminotransferase class V-fold PLP-dependent enzyme [Paenibacillus glycanilyticus]
MFGRLKALNAVITHILQQITDKRYVLVSEMEHISNNLPWRERFEVEYIAVNQDGQIQLEDLKDKLIKLRGQIGLVDWRER